MISLVSRDTLNPLCSPCGRLVIIYLLEQQLSSNKPALLHAFWEKGGILLTEFLV